MCLGTMMFGQRCAENEAARIVGACIDEGVTFIDTAARYGDGVSEEILGRALEGKRRNVFLATKTRLDTGLPLSECVNRSLSRLKTDYIDLYILHWPNEHMNIPSVMKQLNEAVNAGKIRHLGCSNFPAWLLAHANAVAEKNGWAKLTSNQLPYNIIERSIEIENIPQAVAEDIAITVYRPLSIGLLSGRYKPGDVIPKESRVGNKEMVADWLVRYEKGMEFFLSLAARRGVSPSAVAISWVRRSTGVTCPIVGVSSCEQLAENIRAFDFDLSDEEYLAINQAFGSEVREESSGEFQSFRRKTNLLKIV
jgi:aryl-alcohol dehydrogenase-like predicted oxidoreductase